MNLGLPAIIFLKDKLMKRKYKRCEGCLMSICNYAKYNLEDNPCPCTECIVKSMCQSSCEKYDYYEHMTGTRMHLNTYKGLKNEQAS